MLSGIDVSKWNKVSVVTDNNVDFCIIKATEGRTYKDPAIHMHTEAATNTHKLLGFYHYARPDNGNTPLQEAMNFYEAVKQYVGEAIFAVDWEGKSLNVVNGEQWLLQFCSYFYNLSGVRPLVYMSENECKKEKYKTVANFNVGLWVANRKEIVSSGVWKFWTIHQYSSTGFDKNRFNGTREQWLKYTIVENKQEEEKDEEEHYCGCCCCCKCGCKE